MWIAIYLIGAVVTACLFTRLGWLPGTTRARKTVVTTLAITCWPITFLLFLISAIEDIGTARH